jgi:hypothetical protein
MMTETKRPWTPAPWHDDGYRIYAPTDDPDKRNGRVIVEYKHVDGFHYPDARLIAAAPKLAEALIACYYFLTEAGNGEGWTAQQFIDAAASALRAAGYDSGVREDKDDD